jgi:hypothetical protein
MIAPQVTPVDLDHILASAQFFLRIAQISRSPVVNELLNDVTQLRKANNEALVADLIPIIEDAVRINQPIVARVVATVKKHS